MLHPPLTPPTGRSGGADGACALAIGFAVCATYVATLYPSVPGGDAGELIAAVATTGVPHPSGYPLYVLLTKPFLWLPVSGIAWRANFASAVMAAAACAMLAWGVAAITRQRWAGFAAAAVFAFSPTVWLHAVGAEVFSLNNLFIAAELALLIAVDRATGDSDAPSQRNRLVYAGGFVLGLGLSNHLTSLFFNGPFLAAMVWRVRRSPDWRSVRPWLIVVACVAAGGSPYLYLPLASASQPLIEWGDTGTVRGFVNHVLRREYGTFELNLKHSTIAIPFVERLGYHARDLVTQVSWLGIGLAAWGLIRGLGTRSTRFVAVTTASAWVGYLCVLHGLERLPLHEPLMHGVAARFWQAPNLLICVWLGWGVASLRLPSIALTVTAVALAGGQLALHARAANHRQDFIIRDYGAAILESLPRDALVLMRGDLTTNSARYLQTVEHLRPDLRLLDQEMLTAVWMTPQVKRQMADITVPGTHYGIREPGAYTVRELVDANITRRPIVVCGGTKPGDPSLEGVYRLLPDGWCDRVVPIGAPTEMGQSLGPADAVPSRFRNDMRRTPPPDSWEHVAWVEYWAMSHRSALRLLTLGMEQHDDPALLRAAASGFSRLLADHPSPPPQAYKNLGIAYARLVPVDPSAAERAVQAWQAYLRVGPADDGERPAIAKAVAEMAAGKR